METLKKVLPIDNFKCLKPHWIQGPELEPKKESKPNPKGAKK